MLAPTFDLMKHVLSERTTQGCVELVDLWVPTKGAYDHTDIIITGFLVTEVGSNKPGRQSGPRGVTRLVSNSYTLQMESH
jgi:hypothetical protein